jgi:signal transduction histidine kinase/ActR/RegA family two-component response regulator
MLKAGTPHKDQIQQLEDEINLLKHKLSEMKIVEKSLLKREEDRIKIEDSLVKKNRDLSKLTNLSLHLLESMEKKEVLQKIVDSAANLVGTDTSAIYIINGDFLMLKASSPTIPENFPEEFRTAKLINHPHIKKVIDTGSTVIVKDITKATLTDEEKLIVATRNLGSLVYIPLFVQKKVEGVIILGTINRKHDFEPSDIDLFGTFSNITSLALENSYLFENLVLTKEKAEESNRLKTAFLHNISHEIRTPLNAIIGFSGFLGQHDLTPEAREEFLKIISHSNDQLLSVIDDILNISHIEAGQLSVSESGVDHRTILGDLYEHYSEEAGKKGIKFVLNKPCTDDCIIITDKNKVTRILNNLLSNAFKFTHEGKVELGCKQDGYYLEFYVADTGIGIPEEEHKKIFDRFYQIDKSISRIYGGMGLGLSICDAYVKLLGGKIELQSKPGKGSRFTVKIPCRKGTTTLDGPSENRILHSNYHTEKTILVAEDEDTNYAFIKEVLISRGYKILRAKNGKEAIDLSISHPDIDLILMDIRMPVKNGNESASEIARIKPQIPIIAQTAFGFSGESNYKSGRHFAGYLTKPFTSEQLVSVVNKYIKQPGKFTEDFLP